MKRGSLMICQIYLMYLVPRVDNNRFLLLLAYLTADSLVEAADAGLGEDRHRCRAEARVKASLCALKPHPPNGSNSNNGSSSSDSSSSAAATVGAAAAVLMFFNSFEVTDYSKA